MRMYFFCFEVSPATEEMTKLSVKAAQALVFVQSDSRENAEIIARSYVRDHQWQAGAIRFDAEPQPEQIENLDAALQALHRKAARQGIALHVEVIRADSDPVVEASRLQSDDRRKN